MKIAIDGVSYGARSTGPVSPPLRSGTSFSSTFAAASAPSVQAAMVPDILATALADFKMEAKKSPQQRCRDEVMKEWGLTQDSIDALPPDEKKALTDLIDQEVARRMGLASTTDDKEPAGTFDAPKPAPSNLPTATAPTVTALQALGASAV